MYYGFHEKFSVIKDAILKANSLQSYANYQKQRNCKPHHTDHSVMGSECFNSTLTSVIGTLPIEAKIKWQEQLSTLVHAYNCSHSNVSGFSPFYLMYGRQPMLPMVGQFGVRTPAIVASTSLGYIQKLQKRLDWAYKTAQEVRKKESQHSKEGTIKM